MSKHIAWFDFLGGLVGQKTIKTECGRRVTYGSHVNTIIESDCVECIHARAITSRVLEVIAPERCAGLKLYE